MIYLGQHRSDQHGTGYALLAPLRCAAHAMSIFTGWINRKSRQAELAVPLLVDHYSHLAFLPLGFAGVSVGGSLSAAASNRGEYHVGHHQRNHGERITI